MKLSRRSADHIQRTSTQDESPTTGDPRAQGFTGRPVAACSRCRTAKIKCDGKLPACTSCEKNGKAAECTSTNDHFARGKERSYVSTLETRIEKLLAKIEGAKARKPSVVSIPDDETTVPSRRPSLVQNESTDAEPPTPTTNRLNQRREVVAIDDLVSDFGYLSVNATARDFYGFTSAMSYARLILSACTKDPLPTGTTKALPPRHAASGLIQCYFDNTFALLPLFDEASFYASVENVYSDKPSKSESQDHWIVRMVLAIASISMSEQRGDQHYLESIGHVGAALEYAEDVLHPGEISNVQALVLLTEFAMLDPHHFDSWNLIGAASRAMTDLGLHNDPPKGTSMSKGKLELRRRVFYCVYALDRATSLVQTRAFSFSDRSVNVKVPFHKSTSASPTSPKPEENSPKPWLQVYDQALDLIKLRQLQSSWYTELFQTGREHWEDPYAYLWDFCESLRAWFDSISVTASSSLRAVFELELLYSYVYVLSPSPRVPFTAPFAQKLIFEYCIQYADLMLRLLDENPNNAPVTFYDAMRVYMAGRHFLDVLTHSLDVLLNGIIPPHPDVKPTASPPPALPNIPARPGESIKRFNILRSIQCIKQITECLARFGIRWGYMSWNQRYQNETGKMLEDLNLRLREIDEMSGNGRPTMWHANSAGSVSSNGSFSYGSSISGPDGSYTYSSPPITARGSYAGITPVHSNSSMSPPSQYPMSYAPTMQHGAVQHPGSPDQFTYAQPVSQAYEFTDTVYHHVNPVTTPPSQQFASWSGYSGAHIGDSLDEENAVAPNVRVWSYNETG